MHWHVRTIGLCVALAGCGGPSDWERSREAYCSMVEGEVPQQVDLRVALATDHLRSNQQQPEFPRCDGATEEMRRLAGYLDGFAMTAHALGRGRPEDLVGIEEAGLTLSFGAELVDAYDASSCESGERERAAAHIEEIAAAVHAELAEALERCRSVGYQPTLDRD